MKKIKILVVDDELNVRRMLDKVLSKEGYAVTTAADGFESLEILTSSDVDIVISDIKMPGMSGLELLNKAKQLYPDIGFILITAFATIETAIEALKSGAQDYVTKPFDFQEILTAVEKLCLTKQHEYLLNLSGMGTSFNRADNLSSRNPGMQGVLQLAKQVSPSTSTILLTGETGTGKGVVASAIHNWSRRSDKPFICVNCGAIPDNLLESELFGYEKGAFTGALRPKPGRFEIADGGTLFLDEIGDISPPLQVKLLRVLQEKSFERLGGLKPVTADVRIIAATNKNLLQEVKEGRFREDLYYRLNVVPIHIPPLRNRREDIVDLIEFFLEDAARTAGTDQRKAFSPEAVTLLKSYRWPGNIRELENIVERCVVVSPGLLIESSTLPQEVLSATAGGDSCPPTPLQETSPSLMRTIDDLEREVIKDAIKECGGNKTKAALKLGISVRSLHRKLQGD